MKKITGLVIGLFLLAALPACTQKNMVDDQGQSQKAQIANPASTYCIEQGGKLEVKDSKEGQYGTCNLPDGTECEEWAYFRGECPK